MLQNESFIVEKLNYFPGAFYYFDVSTFLVEILHCIYIYFKILLAVFMLSVYMIYVFVNNLVFFWGISKLFMSAKDLLYFLKFKYQDSNVVLYSAFLLICTVKLFSAKWNCQTFFCAFAENVSSNWGIAMKLSVLFNCPIKNKMIHFLID